MTDPRDEMIRDLKDLIRQLKAQQKRLVDALYQINHGQKPDGSWGCVWCKNAVLHDWDCPFRDLDIEGLIKEVDGQ